MTLVQSLYNPDLSSGVSMLPLYCNSFKESKDLKSWGVLGYHILLLSVASVETEESLKPCLFCSHVATMWPKWFRSNGSKRCTTIDILKLIIDDAHHVAILFIYNMIWCAKCTFKKWNSKYKPFIVIYSLSLELSPVHPVDESGVLPVWDVEIVWDIHVCF